MNQRKEASYNREIPRHIRVYEVVRQHISGGVYSPGDLLPSENELCQLHKVTRPTVRKALDRLANEGFIVRHQGKGSIVKGVPKGVGILAIQGTTSAVGKEKLLTRIITGPEIRSWTEAFSFPLSKVEQESGCLYLERLRIVDNKPVFFDVTMIPNINMPRFTSRNLENKSLFDVLRKNYRLEVKGGEQRILAITADERLMHFFGVPAGHPVVQLNRRIETNRPGFFLYSQVFCNTDEFVLSGNF
ncbi:MAG: GntR family transcriptional regulator [Marinilabiliales bacterium]|nr:GntR family transcriptional regulator [Marinilabiliales bacterium]